MKKLKLFSVLLLITSMVIAQHFEVSETEGCDSLTVEFTNLHPSNGYTPIFMTTTGFTYSWGFGSAGTSNLENPNPVTFNNPGPHQIDYTVNIDTIGYKVTGISLSGHLGCQDDTPFDSHVEVYIIVYDNEGNVLLNLEDDADNYEVPEDEFVNITFNFNEFNIGQNLPIWIQIMDSDGFLNDDDNCIDDENSDTKVVVIPPANNASGFGENIITKSTTTTGGALDIIVTFNKPVLTFNASETVQVNPSPPSPTIEPSEILLCPTQNMPEVSASGQNLVWYDSEEMITPIANGNDFTPDVSELGVYYYYATQTSSATGCVSQPAALTVEIADVDGPEVLNYNSVYCLNELFDFIVAEGYNIKWYADENLLNMVSEGDSLDISNLNAGTYDFYVTQTNEDGTCTSQPATINFSIREGVEADISIINSNCFDDASGGATVEIISGDEPFTFQWSDGTTSQNLSNAPKGEYTLTILDQYYCASVFDVLIDAPNQIEIAPAYISGRCFTDTEGEIEALVNGGTPPYEYIWDNGTNTAINSGISAGTHMLTVTDSNGCEKLESIELEVATEIIINSTTVKESCPGFSDGEAAVTVAGGMPPYNYLWSNNSTDTIIQNITAGIYTVTIADFYDCIAELDVEVKNIYDICLVPANVLTPNGDGKNDYWRIEYIELYPNATVQVFDRTGRVVFESTGYDGQFDGTYNGNNLPVGSYMYIIDLKDGSDPMRGFVDIIR
jgi:gliding motility-associated-like protein